MKWNIYAKLKDNRGMQNTASKKYDNNALDVIE